MALVSSVTSKLYSGFDPSSIPECQLWLDANDPAGTGIVPANGTVVSTWVDKSRKGRHLSTGASFSTYQSRNSIAFAGSSRLELGTANINVNTMTVFLVWLQSGVGSNRTVFFLSTNANAYSGTGIGIYSDSTSTKPGGTSTVRIYPQGIGSEGVANLPVATSADAVPLNLTSVEIDATSSIAISVNGTLKATKTNTTARNVIANYMVLGSEVYGGQSQGSLANVSELLVFNTTLTSAQRQQVEGYLARKWGLLSSIPAANPYKTMPVAVRPFSPLDISGCAFWVDAADTKTLTFSGSNVVGWADKSGYGYTGSNNGTITTTTLNGNTVLDFGSSRMTFSNYTQTVHSTTFIVAKATAGNFMFSMLQYGFYIYLGNWDLYYFSAGGDNIQFKDSVNANGTPVVPSNEYFVVSIGYGGGSTPSVYNVNGTARSATLMSGSARPNVTITNPIYINGGSGSSFDSSQVCEIIVYNNPMTNSQAQQVEGYLTAKWGLRGKFPSSHPFKIAPSLAPAFTPLQIPGCALWLDATDNSTLTFSGTTVTSWRDKSGNGYDFNTAPSSCVLPLLGNPINGRQTVGITTSAMGIKQATILDGLKTILWVRRERAGNRGYEFYFGADGSADFHTGTSQYAGSGLAQNGVRDASLNIITASGTTTGTLGGTNVSAAFDVNILQMTNLTGSTRIQGLSYDRGNQYRSIMCDWGEVLFYTTNLSTSELRALEGYFAQRWGLRSFLAASHPYKMLTP